MSQRTINGIAIVMLLVAAGLIGLAVYSNSAMNTVERDPLELLLSDETPPTPDPPQATIAEPNSSPRSPMQSIPPLP